MSENISLKMGTISVSQYNIRMKYNYIHFVYRSLLDEDEGMCTDVLNFQDNYKIN